jgi:hypothetical protein
VDPIIEGSRSNQQGVLAWFNTAAFVTPPSYTFGNVRRTFTTVRGPSVQNLDASLQRPPGSNTLTPSSGWKVFNVTNTPHFSMPDIARQDAAFGTITSTIASPPQREMQLALKISF